MYEYYVCDINIQACDQERDISEVIENNYKIKQK